MGERHRWERAKRPGRLFRAACATVSAALASSVARAEDPPVAVTVPVLMPAPRNKLALVCGVDGLFPTANGSINHPVLRQRGGVADLRDKNAGEPTRQ